MGLIQLLTSLDGRISRSKYWLAAVVLTMASVTGTLLAVAVFGISQTSVVLTVLIGLALFFPTYAAMAKRFQDRGKPGRTALYGLMPIYAINLMLTFGIIPIGEPGLLPRLCDAAIVGLSFWLLIELGMLRGTQGPNRFGPDPLGAPQSDATI
jgi:uncharacterized membrane protein YhaH (DUF805 family)